MSKKRNDFKDYSTRIMTLVDKVALKNNMDPEIVRAVVTEYYNNLNSAISEVKYPIIILPELGRLKLSQKKTEQLIKKTETFLSKPPDKTLHYIIQSQTMNESRLLILKKGYRKLLNYKKEIEDEYNKRLENKKSNL